MTYRLRRLLAALAVAPMLPACQPLPHPFDEAQLPADAPILKVPEAYGIVVAPVPEFPPGVAEEFRQRLIEQLQALEIPAMAGRGNRYSARLTGRIEAEPRPEDADTAGTITWTLSDAAGHVLGSDRQRIVPGLPPGGAPAEDIPIAKLAAEAAPHIAALLVEPEMAERRTGTRIVIGPVTGAPGDGDTALPRSLQYVLQRGGAPVADAFYPTAAQGAIRITGAVDETPAPGGQERVRVTWHVLRPDGSEVGMVRQENAVPKGSLDGLWSEAAMAVASAARDDVLGLVARIAGS